MTIGDRIRRRREELGLTQQELAERVGYSSKTTINKIENGASELRQKKIMEMAKALETSVNYIMGWEESEDDAILRKAMRNERLKAYLVAMAKMMLKEEDTTHEDT